MKRILVAEDDPNSATLLTIRLQQAGYQVITAPDGFRGYAWSVAQRPDLILLDMMLPVATGLDIARGLESAGLGGIPVIFMTASRDTDLRVAAGIRGAGFLQKPFSTQELLQMVSATLASAECKSGVKSPFDSASNTEAA